MSEVRALGPQDLSALAALEEAGFGESAWSQRQLQGELGRTGVVALGLEGLSAAAIGWTLFDEAELCRIVVHPGSRRRGLGARLLRHFLAACKERGAERVFLEVRADNVAAVGLYTAMGFSPQGRRPRYYSDGCDALLMVKGD